MAIWNSRTHHCKKHSMYRAQGSVRAWLKSSTNSNPFMYVYKTRCSTVKKHMCCNLQWNRLFQPKNQSIKLKSWRSIVLHFWPATSIFPCKFSNLGLFIYPKNLRPFILKFILFTINFRINLCIYPKISGGGEYTLHHQDQTWQTSTDTHVLKSQWK